MCTTSHDELHNNDGHGEVHDIMDNDVHDNVHDNEDKNVPNYVHDKTITKQPKEKHIASTETIFKVIISKMKSILDLGVCLPYTL